MAYAAKIENGIVVDVIRIPDNLDETESDEAINNYLQSLNMAGEWKRTSYNNNIRGTFAGIGDVYDYDLDIFVTPDPPEPPNL